MEYNNETTNNEPLRQYKLPRSLIGIGANAIAEVASEGVDAAKNKVDDTTRETMGRFGDHLKADDPLPTPHPESLSLENDPSAPTE